MSINIYYFASLSDRLNKSEDNVNWQESLTPKDVWLNLNPKEKIPENLMCAVDHEYISLEDIIKKECNEIAFFPPVTGG